MRICLIGFCSNSRVRAKLDWCWRVKDPTKLWDTASWNTELIEGLRKQPGVELHVISTHFRMRRMTQHFELEGVHYHYFKPDVPFVHVAWTHFFRLNARTRFFWKRWLVQRWIKKINPDIVNMTGAENLAYSPCILGLKGYPLLVSMQGIYSNPTRFKNQKEDEIRSKFERLIHKEAHYFGVNACFMPGLIRRDNADPVLLWNRYPTKDARELSEIRSLAIKKEYDFVQFSGLNELKGALDTVRAVALVKRTHPSIKVRMVGSLSPDFEIRMRSLMKELGVTENIVLSLGSSEHTELMKEAAKAVNYILPTKLDTIPCTIFEAIHLGLPVVSYTTGDIPLLNVGDERVLLAETGDVDGLARQMMRLLDKPDLGLVLRQRVEPFVESYFSNEANVAQFMKIYRAVINNYRKGVAIPRDLYYEGYIGRAVENAASNKNGE